MITGQHIELDEPSDQACECASQEHNHAGFRCGARPARNFMLSGWPDSIIQCDACSAHNRRLELDLTRECALCGGPLQRFAVNGRVESRKGCRCSAETSRLERRIRELMPT